MAKHERSFDWEDEDQEEIIWVSKAKSNAMRKVNNERLSIPAKLILPNPLMNHYLMPLNLHWRLQK